MFLSRFCLLLGFFWSMQAEASVLACSGVFRREKVLEIPDRLPKGFWNKEKLQDVAVFLKEVGVDNLFLENLKNNNLSFWGYRLRQRFGVYFSGKSIENYVRKKKLYGEWAEILGSLNLPRSPSHLRRQRIRQVFIVRSQRGLSNQQKKVEKDDSPEFLQLLENIFKRELSPWAFYQMARDSFGSYGKAVESAQFLAREQSSEESYIRAIRDIGLYYGESQLTTRFIRSLSLMELTMIQTHFPYPMTSKKFLKNFSQVFGDWQRGLDAANLVVPSNIVRWTPYKLRRTIELLRKEMGDENLSYSNIYKMSEQELSFLEPLLGASINGKALTLKYVRSGGWYQRLSQQGVDTSTLREEARISKENMIQIIQAVGKSLNPSSATVDKISAEKLKHLVKYTGRINTSGQSIREIASRQFGSWDEALVASGFNPDVVRLKGLARYEILSHAAKLVRSENMARRDLMLGSTRRQFENGLPKNEVVDEKDMEQSLSEAHFELKFSNLTNSLSKKESELFDQLLQAVDFLSTERGGNLELSIIFEKVMDANPATQLSELTGLIQKIAKDSELMAAFKDVLS